MNTSYWNRAAAWTLFAAAAGGTWAQNAAAPAASDSARPNPDLAAPVPQAAAASAPAAPASAPARMPTVVVIGRDIGLRADQAQSSTKGSTGLMKTPMAVQVVPQALVDDRQADTLREALDTVSGVTAGSTTLHEDVIVRGFTLFDSYRNGVRTRRFGPTELSNAERVEILKGPSSTQFGRGDIGGVLNVVTKKPQDEPYYSLQQQAGSEGFLQTHLDATNALNESKSLSYRVNAVYEDADSFRDFSYTRRWFLAPTLTWQASPDTRFNLELELARHDSPIDRGIVAVGNRPAGVARNLSYSEPFAEHVNESRLLALDWSHKLDDTWVLRQNLMLERGRGEGLEYPQAAGDDTTLFRQARRIRQRDVDTNYASLELAGTPAWAGLKHDVVVGVDHAVSRGRFDFFVGEIESLDIFNPAHTGIVPDTPTRDLFLHNESRATGLYAQDQVALDERWNLMVAGRYDDAREMRRDFIADTVAEVRDTRFSPRIGIVFTPSAGRSVYAGYTESFSSPNFAVTGAESFDPISARQYEVGFKAESADKALYTTVALYQLTKQNIVVRLSAGPPEQFGQVGEAQSRGLEWDMGGRITPQWNLTASYAYTDAKVTRDTQGTEGNRLYGVPRHAAKAFARYDLQAGGVLGWSFGAGFAALSRQQGDNANTFQIPGYARVDLMGAYKWRSGDLRWTGQVNLINAFDRTYHLPSGARDEIAFGRPRTLLASLRVDY